MATTAQSRVFNAPPPVTAEIPAYQVVEYDGPPIEKVVCRFDEKERRMIKEVIHLEGGYKVIFAKGHSNYYESLAALEAAGLGEVVPLIRINDDAEVSQDAPEKTTQRVIHKAPRSSE